MSDTWYLKKDDEVFGPVSTEKVQGYIKSGKVTLDQMAAKSEDGPWKILKSFEEFEEGPRPIDEMFEKKDEAPVEPPPLSPPAPPAAPPPATPPVEPATQGQGHLSDDIRETYRAKVKSYYTVSLYFASIFVAFIALVIAVMVLDRLGLESVSGFIGLGLAVWAFIAVRKKLSKGDEINAYSDQKLQFEFDRVGTRTRNSNLGCGALILLLIVVGGFVGFQNLKSELLPQCKPESLRTEPFVFMTSGQADAGYRSFAMVKNNGKTGQVSVTATLSSSEGNFERKQKVQINENASRKVVFDFPEPTISATNIEVRVTCSP